VTTKICLLTILALAAAGIGCTKNEAANTNANTAQTTAQNATAPAPDNSEITTTTDAQGNRTETRVFRDNPRVSKVVVTTNKNGTKTTRVTSRTGEERDVKTDENVLEATGDKIADAAGFTVAEGKKVGNEVGDKAEDVKDKGQAVGEKVVDKSKDIGGKTVDKSKDIGGKVVDTTKDVGGKTVEGAKTVGEKSVDVTKKAADKTKKAVKKVIP